MTKINETSLNTIKSSHDIQEIGLHLMPIIRSSCNKCTATKLCEQLTQVDQTVVTPGTNLCNIVRARGPKYSKG